MIVVSVRLEVMNRVGSDISLSRVFVFVVVSGFRLRKVNISMFIVCFSMFGVMCCWI